MDRFYASVHTYLCVKIKITGYASYEHFSLARADLDSYDIIVKWYRHICVIIPAYSPVDSAVINSISQIDPRDG